MIIESQGAWSDPGTYPDVDQAAQVASGIEANFFSMEETGTPTTISDVIGGATITGFTSIAVSDPGTYLRLLGNGCSVSGALAFGDDDFMLVTVGKAVANPSFPNDCGHLGIYWDTIAAQQVKLHPYYAAINAVGPVSRTLPVSFNYRRVEGQVYSQALVHRKGVIEHYALPRGFCDSVEIPDTFSYKHDFKACELTNFGHGAYGTPNPVSTRAIGTPAWDNDGDSPSGNVAQDYAGFLAIRFRGGAPSRSQIVAGLRWCEAEWTNPPASGKRIYPPWITGAYPAFSERVATSTEQPAIVAPTISDPAPQTATEGQTATFTVTLAASGGEAPTYQWYETTAGLLVGETGLSYTTGTLSLTDDGNSYYCIATNSAGSDQSATAGLTVNAAVTAPTLGVVSLPSINYGAGYATDLDTFVTDNGGDPAITWSIAAGALPTGITLNSNGTFSGTASVATTGSVTFTATNSAGATNSNSVSWTTNAIAPAWGTVTLPAVTEGSGYGATDLDSFISSNGGDAAISYTVAAGALPTGITLNSNGTFSGTATTASTGSVTFTATNSAGGTNSASTGWTVNAPSSLSVLMSSTFNYANKAAFLASADAVNFYEDRGGSSIVADPLGGGVNVLKLTMPNNESQAALSFQVPGSNYGITTQAGAKIIKWTWKEYRAANNNTGAYDYGAGEKMLRAVSRRVDAGGTLTMDIIPIFFFDVAQTSGTDALGFFEAGAQSTLFGQSWNWFQADLSADGLFPWNDAGYNDLELYLDCGDHNTANASGYFKINGVIAGQASNFLVRRNWDGNPYLFQQIWLGGWWSNGQGSAPSPGPNERYIKDCVIEYGLG